MGEKHSSHSWVLALLLGLSVLSFFLSLLASGLNYRLAEEAGQLDPTAPVWIISWQLLSLVGIALALTCGLVLLVRSLKL